MAKILSDNAMQVFKSRYAFDENETWELCTQRVASTIAAVEKDKAKYTQAFQEMIYEMNFLPGGRILRNSGRSQSNLLNCFFIPCLDSSESLGAFFRDSFIIGTLGGGVGSDWSAIRPEGDKILGRGGYASGPVSFLKAADAISATVESGGQRRSSILASLDVSHPDIFKFIDAKLVQGILPHFNISVKVNNTFLEAVEANKNWELKFNQKVYRTVPAREIWEKILNNMINSAEPGLLNTSNLYKSNSYSFQPILGVNPCSEICLPAYGNCCLGSIVMPNFITEQGRTNWKKLEDTIRLAVRFLDNVIDINNYPITEIDIVAHNARRIGLGLMGWTEYFFAKKVRYGSPDAIIEIERFMKFFRDTIYTVLTELSVEKGSFPMFEPIAYGKASFIRKLPAPLRKEIKSKGVRCCTAITQPPAGTTSLLPEVTSGCEPLFAKAYRRKDRVSERIYIHPIYRNLITQGNLIENKELPIWFVDTFDLTPKDHLETQATLQRYLDNSISKTLNLPKGTTVDQLSEWLLEYLYDLKGVTVYVDGSREGQVLNHISHEEAVKLVLEGKDTTDVPEEQKCHSGVCEI